jgi:hypothetical protein
MAYLAHGPGANLPPSMSRVVDDGALELEDHLIRNVPSLSSPSSAPFKAQSLVFASGTAASVAKSATQASAAVYVFKSSDGKNICEVCFTSDEHTSVLSLSSRVGFYTSFVETILASFPHAEQ